MKIELLDIDRLIEVNKLKSVTSHYLFSNKKMIYNPDGILSSEIFGISKSDRRSTFAYIDLKRKFIHPHIYANVMVPMFKNTIFLVAGQKRFTIINGQLQEDPNGWTGLEELYNHWNEIEWAKHKSSNTTSKHLLASLNRDQVFIDKEIVCPPAYRDVMLAGTVDRSDHVDPLNNLYVSLIRSVNLLDEGGLFSRRQYATQSKIQDTLVEISNYFKTLIAAKRGLIRRNLMGKSVDYGVRAVISAPSFNFEKFGDSMVDLEHTAVPLAQCCSLFYPFIESWLSNFFTRELVNNPSRATYIDPVTNKEIVGTIVNAETQFSEKNIKKMINDFIFNPDNRFKVIALDIEIPSRNKNPKIVKATMLLKGKKILPNNTEKLLNRPMTITDLLYLACVDTCEDKRHIMTSRYPVGTDKGIFFSKVRVQSTINHIKLLYNGKEYPFYPDVDIQTDHSRVGVQFVDTLVMSNSHLDGMGADYDGDQVSERGIWSDEANAEAQKLMEEKMTALDIRGNNVKSVAKELYNSMYELTKDGEPDDRSRNGMKPVKKLDQVLTNMFLEMEPDEITRSFLVKYFADTVSITNGNVAGKKKSILNTWDLIDIPENHFFEGQPKKTITIGRYVFNKFILMPINVLGELGIVNDTLNKKNIGKLDNTIGALYQGDKITRKQFNEYTDRRDTLGYWLNGMLAHSISAKMSKPLPEIEKKKAELIKKYQKELDNHNLDVMTQISDELVAYAKELLKDDPGMDLYASGDLDFGNNYKNNSIVKGAVKNELTGEFDFIATSFMDGIDVKDIPAHANSILASQYPASISTADAGYMGKKLLALLQMMEIDEPGTDCGTSKLIPITVTNSNKNELLHTFFQVGDQLQELTEENVNNYVGKVIMCRSPMSCLNDKICSKCAGNLFYQLGVKYAGLFAVQISHAALNLGLKAKHNSVVELFMLDPDSLIQDIR